MKSEEFATTHCGERISFPHRLRGIGRGLLLLFLLLTACNAESEYSNEPCYLLYHNAYYLDQTLGESMNPNARGIFCHISETAEGGYVYLNFRNTNGQSSRQRETALETKRRFVLGLNNGLIVGFQSLNDSPRGGFVAYDEQCPNCVRKHSSAYSPKYRLTTDGSGTATCSVCGKRYNMNNRGIILNPEEGDINLRQYIATTTGPQGDLYVHNQ